MASPLASGGGAHASGRDGGTVTTPKAAGAQRPSWVPIQRGVRKINRVLESV
jgi:hypothetical protein